MRRYFLLSICLLSLLFSANLDYEQAKAYLRDERYEDAYKVFNYLGANRKHLSNYCDYYRAVAAHAMDKYSLAVSILERYVRQTNIPYKEEAMELLNECYMKLNKPKEIYPQAIYTKVQKHFRVSEYPEALRLLQIAYDNNMFKHMPEDTDFYLARANMYCAEPEKARKILEGQSGAGAVYYLAILEQHLRRNSAADLRFNEVVKKYPDSRYAPQALFDLARRNTGTARLNYYRQLCQKYPASRYADYAAWEVGWDYYKKKQYWQAIEIFQTGYAQNKYSDNADSLLYWTAKAYQQLNRKQEARELFEKTGREFPGRFYGWRAAQQLNEKPILPIGKIQLRDVRPKTDRALSEFLEIGEYADALEEAELISDGDKQSRVSSALRIYMAAEAYDSDNYKDAIILSMPVLREAERNSDYSLIPLELWQICYPRAYAAYVEHSARRNELDENYVYALIREESLFDAQAHSHADAYGLMQLISGTAANVLKSLNIDKQPLPEVLFQPEINVMLGTNYLRQMLNWFEQNKYLALAAYNAGPTATGNWLRRHGGLPKFDIDTFVENISYTETRNYVKRVMRGYWLYGALYGD